MDGTTLFCLTKTVDLLFLDIHASQHDTPVTNRVEIVEALCLRLFMAYARQTLALACRTFVFSISPFLAECYTILSRTTFVIKNEPRKK